MDFFSWKVIVNFKVLQDLINALQKSRLDFVTGAYYDHLLWCHVVKVKAIFYTKKNNMAFSVEWLRRSFYTQRPALRMIKSSAMVQFISKYCTDDFLAFLDDHLWKNLNRPQIKVKAQTITCSHIQKEKQIHSKFHISDVDMCELVIN